MNDIWGKALWDYQTTKHAGDIITYSSFDEEDSISLPYLFRSFQEMPPLEQKALQLCQGRVLDVGCGAGSHSLYLQEKGVRVTALDSSKGAAKTCTARGLNHVIHSNFYAYYGTIFDTIILLMNGIGFVGRLPALDQFFRHSRSLLRSGGQILLDSSDIIYMFDTDEDGGYYVPNDRNYYGEVEFVMEYKGEKSNPFSWLYLDYNTLYRAAAYHNFSCELVMKGEHYDYLARLTPKP